MTYWNLTDDFSSCSAYDGSKIHVIGHGLLGPKSGFSPSVCSGVVANVVKAKIPSSYHQGDSLEYFPPMLETTAVVHPGSSGGAVVNSEGRMIGLVTSLMYEQDYGDRNESGMYENFCFLV